MSEQERESSFLSFLAGAGLGAILGAALALVFAPQSGEETKEDLRGAVGRAEEGAKGLATRVRESAAKLLKEKEEALARALQDGREAAAQRRRELLEETEEGADGG